MNTERTTYFLMANLGSELIRFFALQKKHDTENAKASATRAFHIMNQISERKDIGNGKLEIAILKNLINDALSISPTYFVNDSDLNRYFMPFAARALAG